MESIKDSEARLNSLFTKIIVKKEEYEKYAVCKMYNIWPGK